ncbi:MAG TPA: coagulation factor 5/8 type domain-containing protein [Terracidiphilus sp.]
MALALPGSRRSALVLVAALCAAATIAFAQSKAAAPDATPVLGPNVLVFSPSMPSAEMQQKINAIYAAQEHSEFGTQRNAILLLPGEYHLDIPVGFYTQIVGLGATPDAVHVTGNVHADASLPRNNATCTFWRGVEGFSISPTVENTMQWAVSQAVFFRRMHVLGDLVLHQKHGWASGGWISDSLIDGNVDSGSQQQWLSRNTEWKSWTGSNWNMVFVGINHPPAGEWPQPPYTQVATTPIVREKPFLWVDAKGAWKVRVPELRKDSTGISWHAGSTPGKDIPLDRFYLAKPGDTAAAISAQLAGGKNLLLTPGIYDLTEPIRITRSNTLVLGLGFATVKPVKGTAAITVGDADGVIVAGVLIDAGETKSPVLMTVGSKGSKAGHAKDPISLHDVFFRVGGAGVGKADVDLRINASDTLIDHTWIWRADHGKGVGWDQNLSNNGLVVDGDEVTAYGLFVEHHQQYQVLWNGNRGRTYFYQSEIPYDPPAQPAFTSATGVNGWASYKVADSVTTHEAWGLGVYSVFRHPDVKLTRAIEVPVRPGVRFHHMMTIALDDKGEITHVINDTGEAATPAPHRTVPRVTEFP